MLRVEDVPPHTGGSPLRFSVEPGQCVGILGGDAETLSRFAEVIAGIRRPAAGRVTFGDLDSLRDNDRIRKLVSIYLPRAANPRASAREHIAAVAGSRGASTKAISEGMARLGIDPARRLTDSGAQSAAALAAALLSGARLVVLPDLFALLDAETHVKAVEWIRSLAGSATAVVITGSRERDVRAVSHSVLEIGRPA